MKNCKKNIYDRRKHIFILNLLHVRITEGVKKITTATKVDKLAIQLVGSSEFAISPPLAVPESRRNRKLVVAVWIAVEKRRIVCIVRFRRFRFDTQKSGFAGRFATRAVFTNQKRAFASGS